MRIATAWLTTKDYCCLLACADVGVSLHASTSGLDLPMKVVDMFGVGLPVLQFRFPCVSELVEDGANGVLFEDAASLARELAKVSGRGDARADIARGRRSSGAVGRHVGAVRGAGRRAGVLGRSKRCLFDGLCPALLPSGNAEIRLGAAIGFLQAPTRLIVKKLIQHLRAAQCVHNPMRQQVKTHR